MARAVQAALQNHPEPMLLVLDNVESDAWRAFVPAGLVRVLATTRDRACKLGEAERLGTLSFEEAEDLAERLAPCAEPGGRAASEREARAGVLKELGGLAIAVEMAARAVNEGWTHGWVGYEVDLAAQAADLLGDDELTGDYGRSALAALDLSMALVKEPLATSLLMGMGVFTPERVPQNWVEKAAGVEGSAVERRKAWARLFGLGLCEVDGKGEMVSVHRLVHRRVQEKNEEAMGGMAERVAETVRGWLAERVPDLGLHRSRDLTRVCSRELTHL